MASLDKAENLILPKESVSSTGGNTAAYETAYIGGAKKRTAKKRSTKKNKKSTGKKGFVASLKGLFSWRKTAKR
jgi:hypothetical protein